MVQVTVKVEHWWFFYPLNQAAKDYALGVMVKATDINESHELGFAAIQDGELPGNWIGGYVQEMDPKRLIQISLGPIVDEAATKLWDNKIWLRNRVWVIGRHDGSEVPTQEIPEATLWQQIRL